MAQRNKPSDGKLGLMDTISIATGFAVGAGVISMTGIAIGMSGRSVFLAFLLSAATILVAFIPMMTMSSVHPTMSANYIYSRDLLHPKVGGIYLYVYFLGRITIATFGISFADYLLSMLPGLQDSTPAHILVAVAVLTLFYVLNLFGPKAVAKIQNYMFYILAAALLIFIVGGLTKVDYKAFFTLDSSFFVNGFSGVWQASALLVFAIGGAGVLTDFGNQVRNPSRVIPRVIVGVTAGVAVLYCLLGIVASGTAPMEAVAYKPLTVAAAAVFGQNSFMYVVFIVGGALLALTTTLNSSFLWYSNAMIRGCEEGWFPKALAKKNRHGVPYLLMTIFYLFGLVPTVLNIDFTVLSKLAVGLTILMWTIPVCGLLRIDKVYTSDWQCSRLSRRMPLGVRIILVMLSLAVYFSQIYSLFKSNPPLSNILIVAYVAVVVLVIACLKRYPGCQRGEQSSDPAAERQ